MFLDESVILLSLRSDISGVWPLSHSLSDPLVCDYLCINEERVDPVTQAHRNVPRPEASPKQSALTTPAQGKTVNDPGSNGSKAESENKHRGGAGNALGRVTVIGRTYSLKPFKDPGSLHGLAYKHMVLCLGRFVVKFQNIFCLCMFPTHIYGEEEQCERGLFVFTVVSGKTQTLLVVGTVVSKLS